jgi:wobble nucleotide-excising tRNase
MPKAIAKIIDHNDLIRDMHSKAVLQTDLAVVRRHEKRIMELEKEDAREQAIDNLKRELGEIRSMLRELLGK